MEVLYQLSYPGEMALASQNYEVMKFGCRAPWHSDVTPA